MESINGHSFFCMWSGGKDSCLALHHALEMGGRPKILLTMMREDAERSQLHNLPLTLIQRQARALGIPLVVHSASWDDYELALTSVMREFAKQGIRFGVFGDVDVDAHREWIKGLCSTAHVIPCFPLWGRQRKDLLEEFIKLKFSAMIIAVEQGVLDTRFLGKKLDPDVIEELKQAHIDILGEKGEYHTAVIDGPLFSSPIHLKTGEVYFYDGYWFLDVSPTP